MCVCVCVCEEHLCEGVIDIGDVVVEEVVFAVVVAFDDEGDEEEVDGHVKEHKKYTLVIVDCLFLLV